MAIAGKYCESGDVLIEEIELPRLDADDRLSPILDPLSKNLLTPDAMYAAGGTAVAGAEITARNIDTLAAEHFPLCMQNLHRELRKNSHLKHFGRLQYTLFLKGIGLSLQECIVFWQKSFKFVAEGTLACSPS